MYSALHQSHFDQKLLLILKSNGKNNLKSSAASVKYRFHLIISCSLRHLDELRTSPSGGRLILPERLGNGLSRTGGLLVLESVSLAEDCDRSGTATSVDGTPCTEDEPNSLFRSFEISPTVYAC
ncbi:hypothetical protein TNCV_3188481 [Trichonephila clavipes]|nr:hypothetical protein TNCV_3188481 [Trichonephila clavipes]